MSKHRPDENPEPDSYDQDDLLLEISNWSLVYMINSSGKDSDKNSGNITPLTYAQRERILLMVMVIVKEIGSSNSLGFDMKLKDAAGPIIEELQRVIDGEIKYEEVDLRRALKDAHQKKNSTDPTPSKSEEQIGENSSSVSMRTS